jgi:hypothetical protein
MDNYAFLRHAISMIVLDGDVKDTYLLVTRNLRDEFNWDAGAFEDHQNIAPCKTFSSFPLAVHQEWMFKGRTECSILFPGEAQIGAFSPLST